MALDFSALQSSQAPFSVGDVIKGAQQGLSIRNMILQQRQAEQQLQSGADALQEKKRQIADEVKAQDVLSGLFANGAKYDDYDNLGKTGFEALTKAGLHKRAAEWAKSMKDLSAASKTNDAAGIARLNEQLKGHRQVLDEAGPFVDSLLQAGDDNAGTAGVSAIKKHMMALGLLSEDDPILNADVTPQNWRVIAQHIRGGSKLQSDIAKTAQEIAASKAAAKAAEANARQSDASAAEAAARTTGMTAKQTQDADKENLTFLASMPPAMWTQGRSRLSKPLQALVPEVYSDAGRQQVIQMVAAPPTSEQLRPEFESVPVRLNGELAMVKRDKKTQQYFSIEDNSPITAGIKPVTTDEQRAVQANRDAGMDDAAALAAVEKAKRGNEDTTEFGRHYLPAFAAKNGVTPDKLTPDQIIEAERGYRELSKDPDAAKQLEALRNLEIETRKMTLGQQPTQEGAKQAAQDIIAHRVAPDQMAQMFGGFGPTGQAFKRMIYAEAKKLDPEFDFEQASAEYQLAKSPAFQKTVRFLDHVTATLPRLETSAKALGNTSIKALNALLTKGQEQFGGTNIKTFIADRELVANELGNILSGGGTGSTTSDSRIEHARALVSESDSPAQIAATIAEIKPLLESRRGALTRGTYLEKANLATGEMAAKPAAGAARNPVIEKTASDLGIPYEEAETRLRKAGAIK